MDLYDFYALFIEALAQDTDLDSWGQVQFGQEISVFADINSESPPDEADMPYIIVHTPGSVRGTDMAHQEHSIAINFALNKETLKVRPDENLIEPDGIELIMDFATLIIDSIRGALPANTQMKYDLLADTIGSLPYAYGDLDMEFITLLTLGTDPME